MTLPMVRQLSACNDLGGFFLPVVQYSQCSSSGDLHIEDAVINHLVLVYELTHSAALEDIQRAQHATDMMVQEGYALMTMHHDPDVDEQKRDSTRKQRSPQVCKSQT